MASEGAFDYNTVYNMPLYLRRFYIKELEEWSKKKANLIKNTQSNTPPNIPKRPAVSKK